MLKISFPYSNHLHWRNPGSLLLSLLYILIAFFVCLYGSCNPSTILLIFPIFLIMPIVSYFITPMFPGYDRKIVLTQNDLRDTHEGLLRFTDKPYPLSSITDCYLDVAEEDKGKQGLLKLSPLRNMIRIIFWGWLLNWMYSKSQMLILLGKNGEKIGEINLSGFYEQDIEKLISALKISYSTSTASNVDSD